MPATTKYIYSFRPDHAEGKGVSKEVLGGKGHGLMEMTALGIPVPPGFTITTEVCRYYFRNKKYPAGLKESVEKAMKELEKATGKLFGDQINPLLVSVRSGAAVSMPGMMDTILNLGLTSKTVLALAKKTGNERFAWDAYRRLIAMFGNVVDGLEHEKFERLLTELKQKKGVKQDTGLSANDLKELVVKYQDLYKATLKRPFPDLAEEQLWQAIEAVFKSWDSKRAITYRRINHIDETKVFGTAANVQAMVFGNQGDDSGTGVAFTRNPSTGERKPYGEYLTNAQGEDVVAGIRTPKPFEKLKEDNEKAYAELLEIFEKLEKHFKEMQDLEFTIENGKLFMLQTRSGKRTAAAAVRIAVEMVKEELIDEQAALLRVEADSLNQLLHPTLDPTKRSQYKVIAKGLPASPGAAFGEVVFTAEEAVATADEGKKVILVRSETSPEDLAGMHAAQGILTARGGLTSHAAVVARGMGKCAVVGTEEIAISEAGGFFQAADTKVNLGDVITLDGGTGEVFLGQVPTVPPQLSGDFSTLMAWADKYRRLGVRTNADTPKDAKVAREMGAEGIGLCRTEHMFFEEDRIFVFRQMILSDTLEQRQAALAKIFPMQKEDFKQLFKIMEGLPVKIRLLDPPLHEFLPKEDKDFEALAKEMGISVERAKQKAEGLFEFNPMMGHRGCRLGVTFPEIYQMQVRAIISAACEITMQPAVTAVGATPCVARSVVPEIMIPLIGHVNEYKKMQEILEPVIEKTMKSHGVTIKYELGTMIEIPRAALCAGEIAKEAEFFSFGTNDLTQMTFGFSRDDAGKFIKIYLEQKILPEDPFATVDKEGVGVLMRMAIDAGRKANPKLNIGICGEHGGDPETIKFCHEIGLNYVSCSPYRVPIARLSAAQAALSAHPKG